MGQVELDAVEPRKLQRICKDAIYEVFDTELYDELIDVQNKERDLYAATLREYVNNEL